MNIMELEGCDCMIQNISYNPIVYSIVQDVKVKKEKREELKEDKRYIRPVTEAEKGKIIDLKI